MKRTAEGQSGVFAERASTSIEWLQRELNERQARNRGYSLRAFAGKLEVSAGRLSQLLNGKRFLTPAMAERIAIKLGYDDMKRERFVEMVQRERVLRRSLPLGQVDTSGYHQHSVEDFKVIAEWHHYAIMSLTETVDFTADPVWIGHRLGISPERASEAVTRLVSIGLLERTADGGCAPGKGRSRSPDGIPLAALRLSHRENLEQAMDALEGVPMPQRCFYSSTMAIDPSLLSVAREVIQKFLRQAAGALETGERREVYNLNVQLVPVTKLEQEPKHAD